MALLHTYLDVSNNYLIMLGSYSTNVEDRRCWNMETGHRVGYINIIHHKIMMASFLVRIRLRGGQQVTWVKYRALIGSAPS